MAGSKTTYESKDFAMTFEEIGEAIGASADAARFAFSTGMKKLRQHPELFNTIRELADVRQSLAAVPVETRR